MAQVHVDGVTVAAGGTVVHTRKITQHSTAQQNICIVVKLEVFGLQLHTPQSIAVLNTFCSLSAFLSDCITPLNCMLSWDAIWTFGIVYSLWSSMLYPSKCLGAHMFLPALPLREFFPENFWLERFYKFATPKVLDIVLGLRLHLLSKFSKRQDSIAHGEENFVQ